MVGLGSVITNGNEFDKKIYILRSAQTTQCLLLLIKLRLNYLSNSIILQLTLFLSNNNNNKNK